MAALPTDPPLGRGVGLVPNVATVGDGSLESLAEMSCGNLLGVEEKFSASARVVVEEVETTGVGGIGGSGLLAPCTCALTLSRSFKLTILLLLLRCLYS